MLEKAIEIIVISITGYVFTNVLILPGMIFDFWGNFLDEKVKPVSGKLADVLGLCVYCFTGQLAFWFIMATQINNGIKAYLEPIGFVSTAIFLIVIIKKKWKI
jgi:hypothetical protein